MAIWISLVVLAQIINAGIVLVDKYLLSSGRGINHPAAYAFYISMLSGVVLIMLPFGAVSWPSMAVAGLSVLTAASYILSIILLYSALKITNASDVVPVVGAVSAIATFSLARLWLHQDLPESFTLAFLFLIVGTLLISHFRFSVESFTLVFFSGLLFGVSAFLIKLIFLQTTFADGFFWSRMANVLGAFFLLAVPGSLEQIRHGMRYTSSGIKWLVVGNKALSGLAFILILLAINLGSVSVVNSLSGLQFVFLLSFAYFGASRFPEIFRGEIHPHKFPHKLFGIILIVAGFVALFL